MSKQPACIADAPAMRDLIKTYVRYQADLVFATPEEEDEFWATADLRDYLDPEEVDALFGPSVRQL